MAHDVEVARDAVRAEQCAGAPGGVQRDAAVVPLEEAGVHRVELSLLLEPRVVQREQRGLDHLGGNVRQLRLHQLFGGHRRSELLAFAGIGDGLFEAGARGAENAEGDAEPGIVEAGERSLQPRRFRQPRPLAHLHLVEVEGAGDAGAHAELVGDVAGSKPSPIALDDEADDLFGTPRPHDGDMGDLRIGDP